MPPKDIEDAVLVETPAEIDLGLGTRASAPAVAAASTPAPVPSQAGSGPRARFSRAVPPGRIASSEEASAMLRGGVPADAETAARLARRLAEISAAGLVPETTDAQARAHLARRRGMARGPQAGTDPVRIAGPVQARLAAPVQAALPGPGNGEARAAVPVAYEPGAKPGNLPAALGRRDVAAVEPSWLSDASNQPRWWNVYDVPRYLQPMIRALGEQTFRSFPCFAAHREAAQAAGEDPLGSITLLACLNGQPNTLGEIDVVASWIRDNGVIVAANQLAFPTMANYAPRVILAAHDQVSYLMVEETVETGAPCNARYVYAWKGGMDFYLSDRAALGAVRALRAPDEVRNALPGEPRQARAEAPPQIPFRIVTVDPAEERRKRALHLKSLPQGEAKPVSSALLQDVRALGFKTVGTPDGPALRLQGEDGTVMLLPEEGLSLPVSATFRARRLDGDGAVVEEDTVESVEDVERFLDRPHLPTP